MTFDAFQILTADQLNVLDATGTYTPTLTATTTNPTLGTGSLQDGWFHRVGQFIQGGAIFQFGTTGADAGSGNYQISLPFPVSSLLTGNGWGLASNLGVGALRDNSDLSTTWDHGGVYLRSPDPPIVEILINNTGIVGANNPWIWAASDAISISFVYLADPAGLP